LELFLFVLTAPGQNSLFTTMLNSANERKEKVEPRASIIYISSKHTLDRIEENFIFICFCSIWG